MSPMQSELIGSIWLQWSQLILSPHYSYQGDVSGVNYFDRLSRTRSQLFLDGITQTIPVQGSSLEFHEDGRLILME